MTEITSYAPDKKPLIIEEKAKEEFYNQKPYIENSINERRLDITAEQYWKELKNSIEFIPFEDYVAIVDKLIDENADEKTINVYYGDWEENYTESGNIPNSYTFMIRLLKAELQKRSIDKPVNIFESSDLKSSNSVKKVNILDDASYSGAQLHSRIYSIDPKIETNVYLVAVTEEAEMEIEKAFKQHKMTSSRLNYQRKLKTLEETLSEPMQQVFLDTYVAMAGEGNPPEYYKWRTLNQPLVITPFKLPDNSSQSSSPHEPREVFIENMSPIKQQLSSEKVKSSYYIEPKFLLDTDKFSGYTKEE